MIAKATKPRAAYTGRIEVTAEEAAVIDSIAARAELEWRRLGVAAHRTLLRIELAFAIAQLHSNGTRLRLAELRDAEDFHFWDDIAGIIANYDRRTGKLQNNFLPRYAVQ